MDDKNIAVLVVDDDRRMVKTICDILVVNGYHASEAYTGEEAVRKIDAERFDCVLMDIRMPGAGGVSALQLIKKDHPDLPVILMSAYATDEVVREAKESGAYTVMNKPFNIQMVLSFLSMLRREETILVVDDDPEFCEMIRSILEARGCSVESEADPDKALKRMEENYKLVVILNLRVGTTSGIEALKAIRAKYPTKPVVLATGTDPDLSETVQQGLRIGAYSCLYQPVEARRLVNLVGEIRRGKLSALLGEPFGPARGKE